MQGVISLTFSKYINLLVLHWYNYKILVLGSPYMLASTRACKSLIWMDVNIIQSLDRWDWIGPWCSLHLPCFLYGRKKLCGVSLHAAQLSVFSLQPHLCASAHRRFYLCITACAGPRWACDCKLECWHRHLWMCQVCVRMLLIRSLEVLLGQLYFYLAWCMWKKHTLCMQFQHLACACYDASGNWILKPT